MSLQSPFLFDDREYFHFGDVAVRETDYISTFVAVLRKARRQALSFLMAGAMVAPIAASRTYLHSSVGSSPAHFAVKKSKVVSGEIEEDLRRAFIDNRNFLGLKQVQAALILGLSESTIEKFEQGVYPTQAVKTKELVSLFNEWTDVLKDIHGDRKFIVRPFLKVKRDALGDISSFEYAVKHPGSGLYDLIGLERKMYG